MNRLTKLGLWLLIFSMICFPAMAEKTSDTEVVMERNGMETTFFHGPIPIRLASPGENDISMEEALRIAQQYVIEHGTILEDDVIWGSKSINYVILSDINESYHIGGWVVTCFGMAFDEHEHSVILDGASGDILFFAHGMQGGIGWIADKEQTRSIALGSQTFLWPVEWRAVFDVVFARPNSDPFALRYALPTENDISQDTALEIAKVVFAEKYGISEREIEQYAINFSFFSGWKVDDEGTKATVWDITFYSTQSGKWGHWTPIYGVTMTSIDGKVIV